MRFFSSSGQDRFLLDHFFKGKRDGVFVEIGATENDSATLFFERFMGWRGLRIATEMAATENHLTGLLTAHALSTIEYCAIEAGAAMPELLAALDTGRFRIAVITLRHPGDWTGLMAEKGYDPVGRLGADAIFKRRDQPRLAQTSVICAVWSGDPKRGDLLRGHMANLARQTVPVEPIYVFDNNDKSPPWLKGRAISVRENLSLYQAWNVALSLARTTFVMNLNLDDRLAIDAVEQLETALAPQDAALIGGEWNITYSQKETDAIDRCYPAEFLPGVPDWENRAPGIRTRLGSGTGEQGTYGPAVMWRLDAHIGAPRYPWRFPEGTVIRSAADAAWWLVLAKHLNKRLLRLPVVIGNYHYHPKEQAQYRALPQDEIALIEQLGVSVI
jgi:hypothetical protein